MSPIPEVSIIIACYNEEGHLKANFDEIVRTMEMTNMTYEIIFVDDCSPDGTREVIKEICSGAPPAGVDVKYHFHEKNKGRGGAVKTGLDMARGRIAGFLDIDLEVHSRYIPSMVRAIDEGADIACGFRVYKIPIRYDDILRDVLSHGYRFLCGVILGIKSKDTEAGYKFFNMETVKPLIGITRDDGWFWDTEIMALAEYRGFRTEYVPMVYIRRADKVSTVKPYSDAMKYLVSLYRFRRNHKLSPTYRSSALYHTVMKMLYRGEYGARYEEIADLIPEGASVVDVCCADAALYRKYLKKKNVKYIGLDINRPLIEHAKAEGADARLFDIELMKDVPEADYVVMQSSLYQFIPNHESVIGKLVRAARRGVIVAEPISNWAKSRNPLMKWAGRHLTNPGTGPKPDRFNMETIEKLLSPYRVTEKKTICNGREIIFMLSPRED